MIVAIDRTEPQDDGMACWLQDGRSVVLGSARHHTKGTVRTSAGHVRIGDSLSWDGRTIAVWWPLDRGPCTMPVLGIMPAVIAPPAATYAVTKLRKHAQPSLF
jgi:hypothetical protein